MESLQMQGYMLNSEHTPKRISAVKIASVKAKSNKKFSTGKYRENTYTEVLSQKSKIGNSKNGKKITNV
jgi:hypothetical protein